MPEYKKNTDGCRVTGNGLTKTDICDGAVFWFGGSPLDVRFTESQKNIISGWARAWWAACDSEDEGACDAVLEHIVQDIFAEEVQNAEA